MSYTDELLEFLKKSPVNFFAIKNVEEQLISSGYKELLEVNKYELKKGDKVYIKRNETSLIALNIGSDISKDHYPFHIIASHSDSPCFKIKPISDNNNDIYNRVNVEPYGGMIKPTWLDRPLGVAGRVLIKDGDVVTTKLINIDQDLLMIPNVCIHFNSKLNSGYEYDNAVDLQPLLSQELSNLPFKELIAKECESNLENILNYDLYLYNHENPIYWGLNKEYISSARLDDLECVFTSMKAFIESNNSNAINVLYIADNEEVGSSSRQGAGSDFLLSTLKRISKALELTQFRKNVAQSYLISADNAHAVHPNHLELTDDDNKCYMNKGIAIKFNASQSYTSDAFSASIFQEICKKADAPYQYFTNRSNIRGGSTLGNILLRSIPLISVDVGIPQLAMHSAYETAGAKDVEDVIKIFKEFYKTNIEIKSKQFKLS